MAITKPFYLGRYEVTQGQYRAVTGDRPSRFAGDTLPVDGVSHEMAEAFCGRLRFPGGRVGLPSEAQWEYACRAGTTTPFHFGGVLDGRAANCDGNLPYGTDVKGAFLGRPAPVGQSPANAFGLYDMHGNMCEWCRDHFGEYAAVTNPEGGPFQAPSSYRVLRGGSWFNYAKNCRSASRDWLSANGQTDRTGFRVCGRLE